MSPNSLETRIAFIRDLARVTLADRDATTIVETILIYKLHSGGKRTGYPGS